MKKSKLSILLLFLVMILAMSAVSAADESVDSTLSESIDEAVSLEADDVGEDVVGAPDDVEVLADSGNNFTSLQNEINGDGVSQITLTKDYVRVAGDNDIEINKDFTIDGQNTYTIDANNLGGIFKVNSGYTLTLRGLTLINGNSENGGAIYNNGGTLNISNSYFINNTATKSGGAIYNNGGSANITGSTFDGNNLTQRTKNSWGGAAIYDEGGFVIISGCTVTNNLKDIKHRGGTQTAYKGDLSSAAVTSSGTLTVSNSYFANNSGCYGGAILSKENGILNVSGSRFENNLAFNGGAIDFTGKRYTITTSNFTGNSARGTGSAKTNVAYGGAICSQETSDDCIISGCRFENNTAVYGGAISTDNSEISGCTFINNSADAKYAEKFNGKSNTNGFAYGDAIYSDSNVGIVDSNFTDNKGQFNTGVYVKDADIKGSSFKNTIIYVDVEGSLVISDNQYDNEGYDITCWNSDIYFDGVGDVPNYDGTPYIHTEIIGFAQLQAMIDSLPATGGRIILTDNISKLDSEYETFADGVIIHKNTNIYADGYTITSSNGKVITVNEGATLNLRDANVVGDGSSAIVNNGILTLYVSQPSSFSNVGENAIENYGTVTQGSITTFTQLNNLIALVSGGEVSISQSKITKADDEKATFADGIVIEKDLTITGYANTNGVISTYIDADNDGRIFAVNDGANLTLNKIILKNGNAEMGGAVYVESANTLIANNVEFRDNIAADNGGAIYTNGGTIALTDCILDGNDVTNLESSAKMNKGGAAIYAKNAQVTLVNTDVTNNGRRELDRSNGDMINAVLNLLDSNTVITGGLFENNTGIYGGAIYSAGNGANTLTVSGATFNNNKAYNGAAIDISSMITNIFDCNFINNFVIGPGSPGYDAVGGAVAADGSGSFSLSDSSFIDNSAQGPNSIAGGVYVHLGEDSDTSIDDCTFEGNTADSLGGAVFAWSDNLNISNSRFADDNGAGLGDAIYNYGNLSLYQNTIEGDDAAIYTASGSITSGAKVVVTTDKVNYRMNEVVSLTASVTDDMGHPIKVSNDANGKFYFAIFVDGSRLVRVEGTYDETNKVYAVSTNTLSRYTSNIATGLYVADLYYTDESPVSDVEAADFYMFRTFTDLEEDIAGKSSFNLKGTYTFNPMFDRDELKEGIKITRDIVISGNNRIIDGNYSARIFYVASGYSLTLNNSALVNGFAEMGGAVYVESGATFKNGALAKGNIFANNTAINGGAIYSEGTVIFNNAKFEDNSAADNGAAIYNNGTLTLQGNTINTAKAEIYNDGIITDVNATILENNIIDAKLGDEVPLTLVLTDDAGNLISDSTVKFTVNGGEPIDATFNDELGLYEATYTIVDAGLNVVSTTYPAKNIKNGAYDVPKENVTEFTVTVFDIAEDDDYATVFITLTGVNGIGLNDTVTVIVNNKPIAITVTNGTGNETIEGLTHGQYPVVAIFDESANYNSAIDSTVFYVKGQAKLTIDEITTSEYGEIILIDINLTDSEGNPISGIVVIDNVINVLVEEGIGTFVIDSQPDVGKYEFLAVYGGDDDYFGDFDLFNVTVTPKVIDPTDIVVDIPIFNEYDENIPVTITSPVDGTYNVYVNGVDLVVPVEVIDGVGSANITGLNVGIYNATVTIADDNYSLEPIVTDDFEYKKTPYFNVNITGTHTEAEITIEGTNGTYFVYIDEDHQFEMTVTEGIARENILGLSAGNNTVFVSFDGENEYYGDLKEFDFTIAKAEALNITFDGDLVVTGSGSVLIRVAPDAKGYFVIDNNGVTVYAELNNGYYEFEIFDLTAGEYTIVANYSGDDNYNKTEATKVLEIPKAQAIPVISDLTTPISTGDNVTFIVTMDIDLANGNVTVYVDGLEDPVVVLDEDYANASVTIKGLTNGTHTIGVKYNGNDNFNASEIVTANVVVDIKVINPEDVNVEIDTINEYGEGINVTITSPVDGNYIVNINGTVETVEVVNGVGSAVVKPENPGVFNATVTLDKEGYSYENTTDDFEYLITPDFNAVIDGTYPNAEIRITGPAGTYHVDIEGRETINITREESGLPTIYTIEGIDAGNYIALVSFDAHDEYYGDVKEVEFSVAKATLTIEPSVVGDKIVNAPLNITFTLPTDVNASNVLAFLDGIGIVELDVNETTGVYTLALDGFTTEGGHIFAVEVKDSNYEGEGDVRFTIEKSEIPVETDVNITIPENSTAPVFTIELPKDATGYLLVDVDGEQYYAPLVKGSASIQTAPLAGGNHTVTVTYTGDDKYAGFSNTTNVTIDSNITPDTALDVPASSENAPTFSVNLPSDATGFLTVDVDGKKYAAVVENGKASVTVPGLSEGNHNVIVSYSGDAKYPALTKNAAVNVHIPVYQITNNKNINVVYSSTPSYKVLITKDGKAVGAGESVTIKFNGKTYTVKTDASGYATLKLNTKVKVKKYTITASYNGVTVKNTVKVKQIIKAYNKKYGKKAKKSKTTAKAKKSKYYKIKIYLKKVNGKYLKKAKIKIKFKGKTYKVKTNKKGKAIWKLKKTIVKKLKKGKKYKYRITYGKAVLTKTIVRR